MVIFMVSYCLPIFMIFLFFRLYTSDTWYFYIFLCLIISLPKGRRFNSGIHSFCWFSLMVACLLVGFMFFDSELIGWSSFGGILRAYDGDAFIQRGLEFASTEGRGHRPSITQESPFLLPLPFGCWSVLRLIIIVLADSRAQSKSASHICSPPPQHLHSSFISLSSLPYLTW